MMTSTRTSISSAQAAIAPETANMGIGREAPAAPSIWILEVEPVKPGYGEGSFGVVRGMKPSLPTRYPRIA